MSQTPEMVTMEYPLEELRCSLCTAYLSCAPIQLLPDGNSICGRCSVTGGEQTYRMLKLEAMLSNTLFPCRYKNNGCEERLVFGHTEEHEVKCDFRNLVCPSIADKACAWEGFAFQIVDHFIAAHPNCAVEIAEFKIQIDQDAKNLLIVRVNNVTFALKFEYTADNRNLYCDIKYLTQNVQEASYKIKLINNEDQDYCIILKGDDCLPLNVPNMQKTGFVLSNFLQILNNPNMIKVAVDFSVIISEKSLTVDLNDFLQTVRCTECQGYLIPPLFDTKTGVVCSNCSKILTDSTPSTDNKLKERAAKANFPCYWIGCNFIARAADFQQHAESCSFRVYECVNKGTCQETFKWEQVITHLEGHGYEYFPKKFVYKFTLNIESPEKNIVTFKNNGIVSVQYRTQHDTEAEEHRHQVELCAVGTDINKLVLKMQFAHEHCKLQSKLYSLPFTSPAWYFNKKLFPACFKETEELTATLEVGNKE